MLFCLISFGAAYLSRNYFFLHTQRDVCLDFSKTTNKTKKLVNLATAFFCCCIQRDFGFSVEFKILCEQATLHYLSYVIIVMIINIERLKSPRDNFAFDSFFFLVSLRFSAIWQSEIVMLLNALP